MKNNWGPLSSIFHVEQPETLIEWKFESITYGRTNGYLTWVGARDSCVSNWGDYVKILVYRVCSEQLRKTKSPTLQAFYDPIEYE